MDRLINRILFLSESFTFIINHIIKIRGINMGKSFFMAEGVGFEPTCRLRDA